MLLLAFFLLLTEQVESFICLFFINYSSTQTKNKHTFNKVNIKLYRSYVLKKTGSLHIVKEMAVGLNAKLFLYDVPLFSHN